MYKNSHFLLWLGVIIVFAGLFWWRPADQQAVRGKSPALPINTEDDAAGAWVQDLALSDPRVIDYTTGHRSEVMQIKPVGRHFDGATEGCAISDCRQVEIYNFDEHATVSAVVDLASREVLAVYFKPGVFAGVNQRLRDLAVEIIHAAPEVKAELGYSPAREDIHLMPSSLAGTDCGSLNPCLGAVFIDDGRLDMRYLWAHVDLAREQMAGIGWSPSAGPDGAFEGFVPAGCPPSGSIDRDGWTMNHQVSDTDGLRIDTVQFFGEDVIRSAKLAEWHVDYGSTGFVDAGGCSGSGGGQFVVAPYGDTVVLDLVDTSLNVVGFELVQDFRMLNWGQNCNYRYEQRYQFYRDGRFRVVAGAYGRGCGANPVYRPLVRIDIAVDGDGNDSFDIWDGAVWRTQSTEGWWRQAPPYDPIGAKYLVTDTVALKGYKIEPGQGQFGDGGLGDDAYIYVVQRRPGEGDLDLGQLGVCCNDDENQGPEIYISGDSIVKQDLVIWYVPQMITENNPGMEYCWTVSGEPNPETYPCFSGPMFHPVGIRQPMGLLWVNPVISVANVGETIDVDLQLEDITNVYGGDFALAFDSSVLQVVDADPGKAGVQIATGACPQPGIVVENDADNSLGTIAYALFQLNPTPPCNGGVVATITFTCVAAGASDVIVLPAIISDPVGTPIPHVTQNGLVVCADPGAEKIYLPITFRE